ncbi:MAG: amidohydrolase [Saprospiraceae bacterium]
MIQPVLQIALLQADLVWNNVEANLHAFTRQIDEAAKEVDLFVLPEMFSTGFFMQPEHAAHNTGEASLQWLIQQAKQRKAGFCGSALYRLPDGRFVNRMFLVEHDGSYTYYDKWHRFAMAGEDKMYATGNRLPVIAEFRGWKILLQVCYDLRFPVYSRNRLNGYDAVVYVANWPETRRLHWRTLLAARAIENQAYCIGVNRIGRDGNDLKYQGDSMVIDPLGVPILDMFNMEGIAVSKLSYAHLVDTRNRLPFLSDADAFKLLD